MEKVDPSVFVVDHRTTWAQSLSDQIKAALGVDVALSTSTIMAHYGDKGVLGIRHTTRVVVVNSGNNAGEHSFALVRWVNETYPNTIIIMLAYDWDEDLKTRAGLAGVDTRFTLTGDDQGDIRSLLTLVKKALGL